MAEPPALERLTGLIAFSRAAAMGSYTTAARSLGISPSAVSKSVQRLERRLGVALFSRTTRSLSLTAEGSALYTKALTLQSAIDDIEQTVRRVRNEPTGVLKVAAPLPLGGHVLSPALPRFRARYPRLLLDVRLSDERVDLIEEGIDVAVRIGDAKDSRLISRRLGVHRLCAYASPAYLAQRGTPRHPDDLEDHDCVTFRYRSTGQLLKWPFMVGGRVVHRTPSSGIILDASDGVCAALVAGGGIGVSASYIAEPHVARGQLVPILEDFAVDRFPIRALWPQSRRTSPSVRAFVAFLAETLARAAVPH